MDYIVATVPFVVELCINFSQNLISLLMNSHSVGQIAVGPLYNIGVDGNVTC